MVLNRKELVNDPRFITNSDRVANAVILKTEIEKALMGKNAAQWAILLSSSGIPAERVALPEDLLHDAQAQVMDIMQIYPDSTTNLKKIPGLPIRFDGQRPSIRIPAPHLEA